jgi:hypothetical protein
MMPEENGSPRWGVIHPVFLLHCGSGCAVVELTPIGEEFPVEPVSKKTDDTTGQENKGEHGTYY